MNPNHLAHVQSLSTPAKALRIDLSKTRVTDASSLLNNQTTTNTLVMSPKFGNYRPLTALLNRDERDVSPTLKIIEDLDPDTLDAPSRLSLEGLRSKFQQIKGVKIRTKRQLISDIDAQWTYSRSLKRKAFKSFHENFLGGDILMARAYFRRRVMREVLGVLVKNKVAAQKKRRLNRSVRLVGRLFRLKVILRAW